MKWRHRTYLGKMCRLSTINLSSRSQRGIWYYSAKNDGVVYATANFSLQRDSSSSWKVGLKFKLK